MNLPYTPSMSRRLALILLLGLLATAPILYCAPWKLVHSQDAALFMGNERDPLWRPPVRESVRAELDYLEFTFEIGAVWVLVIAINAAFRANR